MPIKISHIKQSNETSCGAAALAMVYQSLGFTNENEISIFERIKTSRPNTENSFYIKTIDMAKDAQRLNLSYFVGQAVIDSVETALQPLRALLDASIAPIVCQRINRESSYGHFRVVIGVEEGGIIISDPMKDESEEVSFEKFMKLWEKTNENEVIGGQFLAVFDKKMIKPETEFLVRAFESSIKSFRATKLDFV